MPFALTPVVGLDGSRVCEWDWACCDCDCEFGGERSAVESRAGWWGVEGLWVLLLGMASSGNISSSSLEGEECIVLSPSRSDIALDELEEMSTEGGVCDESFGGVCYSLATLA